MLSREIRLWLRHDLLAALARLAGGGSLAINPFRAPGLACSLRPDRLVASGRGRQFDPGSFWGPQTGAWRPHFGYVCGRSGGDSSTGSILRYVTLKFVLLVAVPPSSWITILPTPVGTVAPVLRDSNPQRKGQAGRRVHKQHLQPSTQGKLVSSTIFPTSIPTYVRGEANLAAGQVNAAPPSFRRSSTTAASSGTAGREPRRIWEWLVPMPYSREPRKEPMPPASRALAASKDFLTLWKDADPDSPILKQAKAEYAKLLRAAQTAQAARRWGFVRRSKVQLVAA